MHHAVLLIAAQLATQIVSPIDRAGHMAELFWDQFTAVQSIERVTQASLSSNGKVGGSKTSEFDYIALLKRKADGVAVEESRIRRSESTSQAADSFLLTSGFPALMLLFHSDFRNKFDFEESPAPGGPAGTIRIAFKSRPTEHSMSALKLRGRFYPILWQGFAWIDAATGAVRKIEATLNAPMEDVGLSDLRTEVEYAAVPLRSTGQSYQLPSRVTVSLRTPKREWRNVHEFTGYRLFTVTTSTHGEGEKGER